MLRSSPNESDSKQSISLQARLDEWERTCTVDYPAPWYINHETAEIGPESLGLAAASFYIPLDLSKYETAEVYLLHWKANLMLSDALNKNALLSLFSTPHKTNPSLTEYPFPKPQSPSRQELQKIEIEDTTSQDFYNATNIAASMEYCLWADNGLFGVGPVILPLNTAIAWFETRPSCREWLE